MFNMKKSMRHRPNTCMRRKIWFGWVSTGPCAKSSRPFWTPNSSMGIRIVGILSFGWSPCMEFGLLCRHGAQTAKPPRIPRPIPPPALPPRDWNLVVSQLPPNSDLWIMIISMTWWLKKFQHEDHEPFPSFRRYSDVFRKLWNTGKWRLFFFFYENRCSFSSDQYSTYIMWHVTCRLFLALFLRLPMHFFDLVLVQWFLFSV